MHKHQQFTEFECLPWFRSDGRITSTPTANALAVKSHRKWTTFFLPLVPAPPSWSHFQGLANTDSEQFTELRSDRRFSSYGPERRAFVTLLLAAKESYNIVVPFRGLKYSFVVTRS